jgi:aquaporin Z
MQTISTSVVSDGQLQAQSRTAVSALANHWPEYLMEAAALAIFMISACAFTVLLEHPGSPLQQAIDSAVLRRALMGIAMGATAVAIIYSPWGKQSGAHMNPSVTLAFFSLGKIEPWDAFFYVIAQVAGGIGGVAIAGLLLGFPLKHSAVNYAVTTPGLTSFPAAFGAEFLISALLMIVVLVVSNTRQTAHLTGIFAGLLVALYITFEAPFSGMSMNPARTLGSALPANEWTALWVYLTAPPIAMILAGQLFRVRYGVHRVFCAKLHHHNRKRCIFRCNHGETNVA